MNDCRALRGRSYLWRSYLWAPLLALLLPPYAGAARDGASQEFPPMEARGSDGAPAVSAKSMTIYVVRRSWHIDVGFAAADIRPPLNSVAGQFPGVRYLFFGFGDRHYLLAKDRNASVLLGALWPGRGMILATGLSSSPQQAFGTFHVAALAVSEEQMRAAQAFIWGSLDEQSAGQDNGALKPYAAGPYEGSLYFAATPRYSAFHTCNTWAAESLAAAALPVHSAGVIFAGQLWAQVRRLENKQSTADLHATDQLHGGLVPSWHTTVSEF